VFSDLCRALLAPEAELMIAEMDDEGLRSLGRHEISAILDALAPHRYQLAHDGYLQFAMGSGSDGRLTEVFVAPEKHFKIWFNNEPAFRAVMAAHGLHEAESLEFLDQYARTTRPLPPEKVVRDLGELVAVLEHSLGIRLQAN
jgi:hypothetical protein